MLTLYAGSEQGLRRIEYCDPAALPEDAVWIDLLQPSPEEEQLVESALRLNVPTREELQEIEASSRLYREMGNLFMTATVIGQADTPRPETTVLTFVLAGRRLITVRYMALRLFSMFLSGQKRAKPPARDGEAVLMGLLDAIVDRIADLLERVEADLDAVSQEIFRRNEGSRGGIRQSGSLQESLRRIGRNGDMTSKASESLVSLARLLAFLDHGEENDSTKEINSSMETLNRDVASLTTHASFLSDKANFLLAATLGMANIEQTDIIKIFTVAAVMFMPPTLVASIYGMNFQFMPELNWTLGYPFAVFLMILSAVLPYRFFKRKGWL
jgi:magnesium transporter